MSGASGLVIGAILGAFNIRGQKRGGIVARAVFGGLMFGTLLFTSSFFFHCVLDGPPMTYQRPSSGEGNIFLQPFPQRPFKDDSVDEDQGDEFD